MIRALTNPPPAARLAAKDGAGARRRRSGRRAACSVILLVGGALMVSGCISVKAPEKPIVIELNINIKQEVVYRLAKDAGSTVENHPEIF